MRRDLRIVRNGLLWWALFFRVVLFGGLEFLLTSPIAMVALFSHIRFGNRLSSNDEDRRAKH